MKEETVHLLNKYLLNIPNYQALFWALGIEQCPLHKIDKVTVLRKLKQSRGSEKSPKTKMGFETIPHFQKPLTSSSEHLAFLKYQDPV